MSTRMGFFVEEGVVLAMPAGLFGDSTWLVLERSLDASALRQRVIVNNVANADTPQFKASTVEFEAELKRALSASAPRSVFPAERKISYPASATTPDVAPKIVERSGFVARNDGNNVDIEFEMTALAENDLFYQAVSRSLSDKFIRLRSAIEGR
jgi:flagellar basal-body rod protein FlgB